MKDKKNEYIETMAFNLGLALTTISKGRAWIEINNDSVKMTGLTKEDAKQAGIIQLMFHNLQDKKTNIVEIQKALDYFGWDLYLIDNGNEGISFRGNDKFLLVQIAHYMGAMDSKRYAEMYRDCIKNKEKVFI